MTAELTRRGKNQPEPEEGERASTRNKKRGSAADASTARTATASARPEPRVDLLPPEVKTSRRQEAIARRLVLALVIVVLVVAAGIAGSTALAVQAGNALTEAQGETTSLALQQQKYAGVRTIQKQIALTQAGQEVGASTEVDWNAFLNVVRTSTAGAGLTITGITLDSASPLAAYEQSAVPLQGTRVATVTLNARATNLDQISAWLAQLSALRGVADVSPGVVTLDAQGYSASAIMHLNESAFDGRFALKGK